MWIRKIALLVMCGAAAPAYGQDEQAGSLNPRFSFSAGTDRRKIAGQEDFTDTVLLFAPSVLGFKMTSPLTRFSLFYEPEFEMYRQHGELNAWNHSGRVYFSRRFSPRVSMDVGNSFLASHDPSRHLGNGYLLLPRNHYRENSVYLNFDLRQSPLTTWSFRFDNTVILYGLPPRFREGFLDQMGNAFTAGVSRSLSPRQTLSVTYSLLRLDLLDAESLPRGLADHFNTHFFTGGYTHDLSPGLTFSLSAGLIRADDSSYVVSGQLNRNFGWARLQAGYSRTIAFLGTVRPEVISPLNPPLNSGVPGSNLFQIFNVRLEMDLSRRFGLELRALASRNRSRVVDFSSHSAMCRARLNFKLSDRLVLFSTGEYYGQNLNDIPGIPRERIRLFGGVEFGLFPAPVRALHAPGGTASPNGSATTEVN